MKNLLDGSIVDRPNKHVVMFWSGGLDSTGLLYKAVTEMKYKSLHVHHVRLSNVRNNRVRPEGIAVRNILEWMKDHDYIHKFTMDYSTISFEETRRWVMYDMHLMFFLTSQMLRTYRRINTVWYGAIARDMNEHLQDRSSRSMKLIQGGVMTEKRLKNVIIERPIARMSKRQVFEMLPGDLRELTWSCRKPLYHNGEYIGCDRCRPCVDLGRIRKNV